MSEAATYKASTFSAVEQTIANHEQQQSETTTETATQTQETQTQVSETTDTNTAGGEQQQTQQEETQENNVSTFNLAFEDEKQEEATTQQSQQQQQQAQAQVPNWKEELKKADRAEILKELGVTDFAIEMDSYLKKGGKAEDYLGAKAVDWNAVTDEDLVKQQLRKEFEGFSNEDIEELYLSKYKDIDSDIEYDRKRAEIQLRADAFKLRQAKIAEQQQFKIPDTVIMQKDDEYEAWKQERESLPERIKQQNDFFINHEATKALNESKRVAISLGEGVPEYYFSVDQPELITKTLTDDGSRWRKLTTTQSGEPDVAKQQLLTLFAHDPQKFCQAIFSYGQAHGVRTKLVEEGQNAQRPQTKVLPMSTDQKPTYGVGKFGDKAR